MRNLIKASILAIVSLASAAAFADSASGVVKLEGDNIGLQTENDGFIAFNPVKGRLAQDVNACLNRDSQITYNDRGMTVDLLSVTCK